MQNTSSAYIVDRGFYNGPELKESVPAYVVHEKEYLISTRIPSGNIHSWNSFKAFMNAVGIQYYSEPVFDKLNEQPLRAERALQHIISIEKHLHNLTLEADWDGNDAAPLLNRTARRAERFLRAFSRHLLQNTGLVIDEPQVDAIYDGTIDILWRANGYRLLVNVKAGEDAIVSFYGDKPVGDVSINPIEGSVGIEDVKSDLAEWMKVLAME